MRANAKECMKILLSVLVLALAGIVFYIIQYYQMSWGDDVLFQYENSHYYYTGLKQWWPAGKISNLSMMLDEVIARWNYFSGRLSTVFFVPLLNILGQKTCSIIGSIVYIMVIVCIARIVWGEWKDCFMHPISLLVIYLFQFHFSPTATYMQMWTFVCHYSMPLVLCLLYYIIWMDFTQKKPSLKNLLIINIFGVYVGATHELLPLYCFILIGIRGILIYRIKFFKPLLKANVGILLGYLIVFFAPGNWVRMGIDHDIRRIETAPLDKLLVSIKAHIEAFGMENLVVKVFFAIALLYIGVKIWKIKSEFKECIFNNLEFIVAAILSIVLWAIVAPPVAQYSLPFFKALVLIVFLRAVKIEFKSEKTHIALAGITILLLVVTNIGWCNDLVDVTSYRRQQIETAKEENKTEVTVINYPESTANYYTYFNCGNIAGVYDTTVDTDYYGIRVITVGE